MNIFFNRIQVLIWSTVLTFGFAQQPLLAQCPSGWSGPLPNQCTNSPVFQLTTGTPASGVYIGTGVTGSGPYFFSPQLAGPGTYSIGHIAPTCTDTAFTTITVNSIPNVSLAPNGPFCENADSSSLTGGLPVAGGTGYYYGTGVNGTSGKFGPTVGPGPHTIGYTFTSGTTGCSDSAEITITVNTITAASLSGLDTAYCINAVPSNVPVTGSPVGGTLSGPGISGSNFNIASAGVGNHTIRYVFTNGNGCTDTAKANVHVRALPVVSLIIPPSQKFSCEFDGPFVISGHNPTSPGYPFNWFTGTGVDTILGTFDPDSNIVGWNAVTYHYFDGVCANTVKDSILVNENPVVTLSEFPKPCANDDDFQLTQGSPTVGGLGVYTGNGVTGIGPYFFDPKAAGPGTHPITYCFTGSNGCETCVTQNIVVNDVPTAFFAALDDLCENGAPRDISSFGTPAGGYFTGLGMADDSLTIKSATLPGPGDYIHVYHFTDANGCSDTASQTITINPKPHLVLTSVPAPTPNPPLDSSELVVKICVGDTANVMHAATPSSDFAVFPSLDLLYIAGGFNAFPPTDQEYAVVAQAKTTFCKDTGHVLVKVIPQAIADILGDSSICIYDTTTLTAAGANTYQWVTPVATTPAITVAPTFTSKYQVIAISDLDGDGKQCSIDTTSTTVTVNPLPLITASLDTSVFIGDVAHLSAYGGDTYVWSANNPSELSCLACPTPDATPVFSNSLLNERVYHVTGTDTNGCVNVDSVIVGMDEKVIIFVPTAFSPNGDGYNDQLFVKSKGIRKIDFEIYDRFGKTVFSTTDMEAGWDGTVDGNLLTKDVFLYKLSATPFKSSIPIEQAGQITLIR